MPRTALQWLSLVGAIWLQSINGTNSNFPAYSSQLKQLLSLSQLELNNLAFANDAGKLFGWIAGIAALYLPLWLVLLIGSCLGLVGYGVQYLFLIHKISSLSYWHIFFLTVLAGNSICWINTVCYIVTVRNFPLKRQAAVGISTGYIGLSPVVYTALVNALASSPSAGRAELYLLFNSVLPLIVGVLTAPLVSGTYADVKARGGEAGFMVIAMITIATGVYGIVSSLKSSSGGRLWHIVNLIGIASWLITPLVIPFTEYIRGLVVKDEGSSKEKERRVCDSSTAGGEHGDEIDNEIEDHVDENQLGKEVEIVEVATMEEIGVKSMVTRLNFWVYVFVYFSGATVGLVYLNNLGQIAESRGYSSVSSLVSLSSAFGFFGRLLPCFQHYVYSRRKRSVPGPASIVALMVPISGAFFLLLNGSDLSLYVSTAVIGACTGAITTISVSVTTELFGTKNFGVNHNVVVANIPIGSFVFGDMAAFLYRRGSQGSATCIGLDCYGPTFVVWGGLCCFGTLMALLLHLRTRTFYMRRL